MSVRALLGEAYRLYRAHFRALFALALLTAPFTMLAVVARRQVDDADTAQSLSGLIQIAGALVSLAVAGAIVGAVKEAAAGRAPEFGAALDAALGRYWALLTTGLLTAALVLLSIISWPWLAFWWLRRPNATIDSLRDWRLVWIPLALPVYLLVRWTFTQQAVMIEGERNWAALDRSGGLVRGRWGQVLRTLLSIVFVTGVPIVLATVSTLAAPVVDVIVTAAVSSLMLPFAVTAMTLLYLQLTTTGENDAIGAD
ncbi:MAG: hypothetical protein WEC75_05565 [Dehalococcoidia bacterium]